MRALLLAAFAPVVLAQPPQDPPAAIAKARAILAKRDKRLPDYTCVQTVDRQYFVRLHPHKRRPETPCALIAMEDRRQPRDLVLSSTDRLRLDVKVSHGDEIGVWAGATQFGTASVFDLIGGGPYGTGMLGTLIADIFGNNGATYQPLAADSSYGFRVPVESSHYRVKTYGGWITVPFSGSFWLDATSLELRRLKIDAAGLPADTGACEAATTVDYRKTRVGNGEFLLPGQSVIHLVLRDESESESTAVYSGCREYVGESTLRFDNPTAAPLPSQPAQPPAPVPPNLPLAVTLVSPIDTATAAAGDTIAAKLRRPLLAGNQVLAPAGAIVHGRIVQMQHWVRWPAHYMISIRLETLEVRGVVTPLFAIPAGEVRSMERVAAFTFWTNKRRYVVRQGLPSTWVTVGPPSAGAATGMRRQSAVGGKLGRPEAVWHGARSCLQPSPRHCVSSPNRCRSAPILQPTAQPGIASTRSSSIHAVSFGFARRRGYRGRTRRLATTRPTSPAGTTPTIYEKLHVHTRSEAVARALRDGLIR